MIFLKTPIKRVYYKGSAFLYQLIPYIVIGGGTAGYYTSLTIRARDPDARVLIVSEERESPYRRSHFSKEFWWYNDELTKKTLSYKSPLIAKRRYACYESDGFYLLPEELENWEHGGIALMCDAKVQKIDSHNNYVELESGQKIEFAKCLIATGSIPLHNEFLKNNPDMNKFISVLGNVDDYRKLHDILENYAHSTANSTSNHPKTIVILGGGLLASELAYSLNRIYVRDKNEPKLKIILVSYEQGVLADILPNSLTEHATETLCSQGIEVIKNNHVNTMTSAYSNNSNDRKIILNLVSNQKESFKNTQLICDHLIIASGAEPNVELAQKSGLKLDKKNGGIFANEFMNVKGNLSAAGDVCSFFDPVLGYRRRSTHWQNAQISGRIAGENMTLGHRPYSHQGAFLTMLGPSVHICGIGDVNPRKFDTTVLLVHDQSNKLATENEAIRAVVLYTNPKTHSISGVLLYNVHDLGVEFARKLIVDAFPLQKPIQDYAKLFELWETEKNVKEQNDDMPKLLSESEEEAYQMRED